VILFAFSNTPKLQFSKTELSVLNPIEQFPKQSGLQMVFKMSTVTFFVDKAF